MAEAVAVLSLISSVATLIDLTFKVVDRLHDFTSRASDIPDTLSALANRLPLLARSVRCIKDEANAGRINDDVARDLDKLVENLITQVEYVKQWLDKLLPSSSSSWDRALKGLKSLIKEEKLTQTLVKIHQSIDVLVLHQSTNTEIAIDGIRKELGQFVINTSHQAAPHHQVFGLCLQAAPVMTHGAFVGREEELRLLHHLLQANVTHCEQKIVSVVGTGGMGKTQLGLTYARKEATSYSSIFWLDAQTESGLRQGIAKLCEVVFQGTQYQGADEESVRVEKMRQWLSEPWNDRWLLIFDNYDDPSLPGMRSPTGFDIRSFFPVSSSHGSILITTRSPKLGFTEQLELRKLEDLAQSIEILAYRSGRDIASDPCSEDLAIRLDGLPLALATAGTYLRETSISCAEYLQLYEDEWLDLNGPDSNELYEYADRRLSSTWAISLRQVQIQDPDAAELLQFFAYFNNQDIWFELFNAGSEAGPTWLQNVAKSKIRFSRAMAKLRDYSLVDVVPKTASYRFHQCLHDWLSKSCPPMGELFVIAGECLKRSVVSRLDSAYWIISHRVLPHGLRLASSSFDSVWESPGLSKELPELGKSLGDLFSAWDKVSEAEIMYVRALDRSERVSGPNAMATLNTANNLGLLYRDQGKLKDAEKLFTRALVGYEQAVGPDHRCSLNTVNNLGLLYLNQGMFGEAEQMFCRALAGKERTLGKDHVLTHDTVYNLGILFRFQGRLEDSEKMYLRCLPAYERILGSDHISTLDVLQSLATLYRVQGRLADAETMYMRSLAGYERVVGTDQKKTVMAFGQLGSLFYAQGKLIQAKQMYSKILALPAKDIGEEYVRRAVRWTTIILIRSIMKSAELQVAQLFWSQLIQHMQSWSKYAETSSNQLAQKLSRVRIGQSIQITLLEAFRSLKDSSTHFGGMECRQCQGVMGLDTGLHSCCQCDAIQLCDQCMLNSTNLISWEDSTCNGHDFIDAGLAISLARKIVLAGDETDSEWWLDSFG